MEDLITKNEKEHYFNDLLEVCIENNQYVGLGNPYANILFIGKEAGFDPNNKNKETDYNDNANKLKLDNLVYAKAYIPEQSNPDNKNLLNKNHTWQKYQKLYNLITGETPEEEYKITFVKNVFTTELSNLPFPNTRGAKERENFKEKLQERKEIFFNSKFIKSFPIVVITALDTRYIKNAGKTREIDNIFDVVFERPETCNKDKYWVHKSNNENFPKLLIHTRQLTNGASNDLIIRIAEEIKKFADENSINVK